jgi:hypothetical protein
MSGTELVVVMAVDDGSLAFRSGRCSARGGRRRTVEDIQIRLQDKEFPRWETVNANPRTDQKGEEKLASAAPPSGSFLRVRERARWG